MKRLSPQEAIKLFKKTPLQELGFMADEVRERLHPEGVVTFVVDRNINYTNVCINQCLFCAYYRQKNHPDAYILDKDTLKQKIEETISLGGTQILLQGGLHPDLGLSFYLDMVRFIKKNFSINLHGFSPPEIWYLAEREGLTIKEVLQRLKDAGLDSIPGGGAEILSDRVRLQISPRKINSSQWLEVMRQAHLLGMRTTATMMFGTVEEPEDIVAHLDAIRSLQDETGGFTAFIPWSFQVKNTALEKISYKLNLATGVDYLRVLALSRLYLDNFANIQASWVTQGLRMAQLALRFGANDFGSTMLEENVVRAAGVCYKVTMNDIIEAIRVSGFKPAQRDTYYNILKYF